MHMISNQQRQDVIDFLTSFIELTADKAAIGCITSNAVLDCLSGS